MWIWRGWRQPFRSTHVTWHIGWLQKFMFLDIISFFSFDCSFVINFDLWPYWAIHQLCLLQVEWYTYDRRVSPHSYALVHATVIVHLWMFACSFKCSFLPLCNYSNLWGYLWLWVQPCVDFVLAKIGGAFMLTKLYHHQ